MCRMIDGIEMRSDQRDRTRATSESSFIGNDIRSVATWHPHVLKTDLISHRLQPVPHFSCGNLKVAGQRVACWMRCQLNQCRRKTVTANGVHDTLDPFIDTRRCCRARQCLKDDLIFFAGRIEKRASCLTILLTSRGSSDTTRWRPLSNSTGTSGWARWNSRPSWNTR